MKRIALYLTITGLFAGLLIAGGGEELEAEQKTVPAPVLLRPFNNMILDTGSNFIIDTTHSLNVFYEKLGGLKTARRNDGTNVVSIFHLGDSHIQAGFLTGAMMRHFHQDFGNAGRGLITPLKMAKTNEPADYIIRSGKTWESTRLVQSKRAYPLGVGGVSIAISEPSFSLTISALEKESTENYSFNRVRILKYPGAPELSVDDEEVKSTAGYIIDENPYLSTIVLNRNVSELTVSGQARESRDSSIYYGFVLENTRNGILYHAAGINGAQFQHWTRPETFCEQTAALEPSLVILSMGTNESLMGKSFSPERFSAHIDSVVCGLKVSNPQSVFLFTTPPESFLRQRINGKTVYKPNPLVETVSRVIVDYAARNGYACWDLFALSGGKGSCEMWKKEGLFSRDNLHFTAEGYEVLANYFYQAIINGYNQYVRDHYGEPAPDTEI